MLAPLPNQPTWYALHPSTIPSRSLTHPLLVYPSFFRQTRLPRSIIRSSQTPRCQRHPVRSFLFLLPSTDFFQSLPPFVLFKNTKINRRRAAPAQKPNSTRSAGAGGSSQTMLRLYTGDGEGGLKVYVPSSFSVFFFFFSGSLSNRVAVRLVAPFWLLTLTSLHISTFVGTLSLSSFSPSR